MAVEKNIEKPQGKTVANRLFAYCRKKGKPFDFPIEEKQAIGKMILEKFYGDGKKFGLPKVENDEPEGTFMVLLYPAFFVPVMDALIIQYFKNKLKQQAQPTTSELRNDVKDKDWSKPY